MSTVASGARVQAPTSINGIATTLEAHQSVVWSWNKAEWFPLEAWGYELREPDTYTIHRIPQISGPWVVGDWKTVRSNTRPSGTRMLARAGLRLDVTPRHARTLPRAT